jgi:Family of unknown function (DUF6298)/Cellulase (glycosyl hydrolase family 5)/Putative collagen-binding domain of a collagenase
MAHPSRVLFGLSCILLIAVCRPVDAADPKPVQRDDDSPIFEAVPPLSQHPDNPHYLLFNAKPTILVGSTEHYGAVLNLDFDYVKYLDELHTRGLNLTRTFSGSYHELPSSFGIVENTLAPKPDRFIGPWPRSATPGAGDGLNKYDLNKWNEAYFIRLKDFVREANKRGVVVEVVLFCTIYDDKLWGIHPFNPANNVQQIGPKSRLNVYTLKDKQLTAIQEQMVTKIVNELQDSSNVYYEICNEPYFGGVTPQWSKRMADVIRGAERGHAQHLIAQNIANGSATVKDPDQNVSIFNFHYAIPPDAVAANAKSGRIIADDETGFKGKGDLAYRAEGWNFLLAGGAIYDNLDYSFTPHHPDGSAEVTTSPGGAGENLRKQLAILKTFVEGLDFIQMVPDNGFVKGGLPAKAIARTLAKRGEQYAVYIQGGARADLIVDLPAGKYRVDWLNPRTGRVDKSGALDHSGGTVTLASPDYAEDIALRIVARK